MTGYQTFYIELCGNRFVTLSSFEFNTPLFSCVEKVEVSSPDERKVEVKVIFQQIASKEEAASIGWDIATQVANNLAFELQVAARDPIRGDAAFGDGLDHSLNTKVNFSQSASAVVSGHVVIPQDEIPSLAPILEIDDPFKDVYKSQFRWIMCQDDPISRFMLLYKILLSLEGGTDHTQRPVDDFLKTMEPSVQTFHCSNANRNVTIYTRLRNEVGHEIPGTSLQSTRQGMEQHIGKLSAHVKSAISRIS